MKRVCPYAQRESWLSLAAVYKESFICEVVMCDSLYFSVQHGIQERKTIEFKTEEKLADALNETVNDSDSDTNNIPECSSSEESESESANESDNESNISISDPSRRPPTTGFSENDHQARIPPFIGNPGVEFAVENQADVMSYCDQYVPPELIEIVVDQTNLYAQQQNVKMPRPVTK